MASGASGAICLVKMLRCFAYRHCKCRVYYNETSMFSTFLEQPLLLPHRLIQLDAKNSSSVKDPNLANANKRKEIKLKINLVEMDENVTVMFLDEAEKLAKRRNLKLVRVVDPDTKTRRPIYRLMTGSQYFVEDLQQRKLKAERRKTETKGEKLLSISDKIGEHDLQAKMKILCKWLEKNYEARIVITDSETNKSEKIVKTVELSVKECGQVAQKQTKGKEIKLRVLPKKKEIEEDSKELN